MNDNIHSSADHSSARRRLIRGSFAAPVALTLFSGSSFAAGSSLRCVVNRNVTPQYPSASTTTDTWIRVQLWTVGSGTSASTWASGQDVSLVKGALPVSTFISATQWQCVTAGDGTGNTSGYTVGQVISVQPVPIGTDTALAQNGKYGFAHRCRRATSWVSSMPTALVVSARLPANPLASFRTAGGL
ncbi:MAG: hypothetical protein IPO19_00015 [Rhodoferax sp.]|nr:hypothetical protein [Rhodoferax sp.]